METMRASKTLKILDTLNLSPQHVFTVTDPMRNMSANAPYHKAEHLFTVTLNCYEASLYYNFTVEAQQVLILAALYHDFNHSAGEHPDWVNILSAVAGAVDNIPEYEPGMDASRLKRITQVIHSTQYPAVSRPRNILECIIRDADILQTTEEDELEFISGLNQENGSTLTLESSRKFLKGHSMFTWWGERRKRDFFSTI